ncbi:MAG: hypothetical protein R6U32_02835 [Candidatus Woesearchaeota archaeon]
MGKRGIAGLFIAFVLLVSASSVSAEHTSTAELDPVTIYETLEANFTLEIENDFWSEDSIYDVALETEGVNILSLITPTDWTSTIDSGSVYYETETGAISSWDLQKFGIALQALKVDENRTYEWSIKTEDNKNETHTTTVELNVINDATPPALSDPIPYDGLHIKEGTDDQEASITAIDNETGVKQVKFNYDDCAFLNDTKHMILEEVNSTGHYEGTANLSEYEDPTKDNASAAPLEVCFSFNAENNGGNMSVYMGEITIDGAEPEVELVSPADNALMNSQSDFEFTARDNLAPNMSCELLVDGEVELDNITAYNNETTTISVQNVSEGVHEWAVRCEDLAGWNATSGSRTYTLDRTPPSIKLAYPPYLIIAEGTDLGFTVTDNFELDGVSYNHSGSENTVNKTTYDSDNKSRFEIGTDGWPEGPTEVHVDADDAAGNNASRMFVVIVDKTAPEVDLLSPVNESDVKVNFTFNTSDDYDSMIDCTLYVGKDNNTAEANGTATVNTSRDNSSDGGIGIIRSLLGPGNYTWSVECVDDAGNEGRSGEWNLTTTDTSGPEITFSDANVTVRGNNITINSTITDISGVDDDSVRAVMKDPANRTFNVSMSRAGDTDNYAGSFPTDENSPTGNYTATVHAADNSGNEGSGDNLYRVTYAYELSLALDPNPAETGEEVEASGTVLYDNGSLVPEEFITLSLPDTTMDAVIDNSTGGFSHIFEAPDVEGGHETTAQITAGNGFTFSAAANLTVIAESEEEDEDEEKDDGDDDDGGSSDGPDSSTFQCPVGECYSGGECVPCVDDEDEEEDEDEGEKEEDNDKDKDKDEGDEAGILEPHCGDKTCNEDEDCESCPEDCGECEETEGVGAAGGFLNIDSMRSSILWILLVLAIIAFMLVYLNRRGGPESLSPGKKKAFRKNRDKLNLDEYLERRS